MKQLDLQIIRSKAPYDVIVAHNGDLLFKTDFDVEYAVSFEEDNNLNMLHSLCSVTILS